MGVGRRGSLCAWFGKRPQVRVLHVRWPVWRPPAGGGCGGEGGGFGDG